MVDLGVGSGILPIVMKENANFNGKIFGFDMSETALECAKMNLSLFGVLGESKMEFKEVDIIDIWFPTSGTPSPIKFDKEH